MNRCSFRYLLVMLRMSVIAMCCVWSVTASGALKGRTIDESVSMLHSELTAYRMKIDSINRQLTLTRAAFWKRIDGLVNEADEKALMLYSQQTPYVFGLALSAENTLKVVDEFDEIKLPVAEWRLQYDRAIARLDKMRYVLNRMDENSMCPSTKKEKAECVRTVNELLDMLGEWREKIKQDEVRYAQQDKHMQALREDVENDFDDLHHRLFSVANEPYTAVIANWNANWSHVVDWMSFLPKYGYKYSDTWNWEILVLFLAGVFAFLMGLAVGVISRKRVMKWNRCGKMLTKDAKVYCVLWAWVVADITLIIFDQVGYGNSFIHAGLPIVIESIVMLILMLSSVVLRVESSNLHRTLLEYAPVTLLTMVCMFYRMLLVSQTVIVVTIVPVLIVCCLLQLFINRINKNTVAMYDRSTGWVSFCMSAISLVIAWNGYYLFAVQICMFWIMMLSGHLLLSCIYSLIAKYEKYKCKTCEDYGNCITHLTIASLCKPLIVIFIFLGCIAECAHIFNINALLEDFFTTMFLDFPGVVRLSLVRAIDIALAAIVTNYFIHLCRLLLKRNYANKANFGATSLTFNICSILIWGVFVVLSMTILEVNHTGLIAAVGGITVGVGIALRDTLDCLFCGVSMMMGRVHIGDVVICEGVRGVVTDIQYRTTQIETEDGAVISFFNTSFFGKNYRNLTHINQYEREQIHFKISKEADIDTVRSVVIPALRELHLLSPAWEPKIHFFAAHRFDVEMLAEVWVPVVEYDDAIGLVGETIYTTLRKNGIDTCSEDVRTRELRIKR